MSSEVETSLNISWGIARDSSVRAGLAYSLGMTKKELRAAHIGAGAGIDLDGFAFFDEERDVNGFTGLEFRRLGYVAGGIATDAFGRLDPFQADPCREFHLHRFAFSVENLHR